jgi:hypothetical protein
MDPFLLTMTLAIAFLVLVCHAATTARLRGLEYKLNALLRHHGAEPTPHLPLSERAKELAADPRRKIDAIKIYREETGAGLAEAKDAVEAYQQQLLSRPGDRPPS